MKIEEENIGRVFKDAFENYSVNPNPKVWKNVKAKATKKLFFKSTAFKLSAGAVASAIIIAAIFVFTNPKSENIAQQNNSTQELTKPNKNNSTEIIKPEIKKEEVVLDEKELSENINKADNSENINLKNEKSNSETEAKSEIKNPEKTQPKEIQTEKPKKIEAKVDSEDLSNEKKAIPEEINIDKENISNNENLRLTSEASTPNSFDSSSISFKGDSIICFGEDAKLVVSEGFKYLWNNGKTTNQITVSPVFTSDYTVEVTDEFGNKIEHNFKVEVDKSCSSVMIPSAFSPDNDGINDKFEIYAQGLLDYEIRIFNRQGQLLFVSNDINQHWDGTYNGETLATGVYVYRIAYTDAKGNQQIKQGTLSIVR
jgi:gliding motility-associated-like protein